VCAGLPEAVSHLSDGYVCSDHSAQALGQGIRYFLDDAERRRAAGEEARRSLERFSPARAAGAWVEIFRGAAKRGPAR
jgi:glycosyltransferase involved in cell wall biosynthesis